jgi:hypothetical protein
MILRSLGPGRSIVRGAFALAVCSCGGPPTVPVEPADLKVITSTTGLPLPDGYTVSLSGNRTGHLDTNGSLIFTGLDAGEYTIELSPLPPDCRVTGENPRTVTLVAGSTTQSVFQVRCIPPNSGTLLVRTATYGDGPTQYDIILDDGLFVETIFNDELLTLFPVPVGARTVRIEGVPLDCQLVGANPRVIIIREPGSLAGTVFKIHCPG